MAFLTASTFPVAVASISARSACGFAGFAVGDSGFATSAIKMSGALAVVGSVGCDSPPPEARLRLL
jgi:hypothetical protein